MAMEWIELVDVDRNGAIELGEFFDFFRNIDGVYLSDDEMEQMFRSFDKSGDGSLTMQEFAQALYLILVPEGLEDDNSDDDNVDDDEV
jgi:Ca2+-binding EF-hand superfamily protein